MKNKSFVYLLPPFLWALLILYFSIVPSDNVPKFVWNLPIANDKIGHFGMYAVWVFISLFGISKSNIIKGSLVLKLLIISTIIFFYGILMELLQLIIFAHRKAELLDVVFNVSGIILGVLAFIPFNKLFLKYEL